MPWPVAGVKAYRAAIYASRAESLCKPQATLGRGSRVECARTGPPETESIAGRGDQELLISRWDGDGGRAGLAGLGWVGVWVCGGRLGWGATMGRNATATARSALQLQCTVTAGRHECGGGAPM